MVDEYYQLIKYNKGLDFRMSIINHFPDEYIDEIDEDLNNNYFTLFGKKYFCKKI